SSGTPPLRTAATTAALRRTTHLLVFGCGSCSMSRVPPTDFPRGVFMRRRQAALGRAWAHQDPPEPELVRTIAACSRVAGSTPTRFTTGPLPSFTIFSRSWTRCHQLFSLLNRGPTARKWYNLGVNVFV